jgi:hypothetical protein
MLERNVEAYFIKRVEAAGGEQRKLAYVGRRNATDRLVIFRPGRVFFVELKKPGATPRIGQVREHQRLREMGCNVRVIDTCEGVDKFIGEVAC